MSETGVLHNPQHGGAHENENNPQLLQFQHQYIEHVNAPSGQSIAKIEMPCHETHSLAPPFSLLPDAINNGACEQMPEMAMEVDSDTVPSTTTTADSILVNSIPLSAIKADDGSIQYVFQQNSGSNTNMLYGKHFYF